MATCVTCGQEFEPCQKTQKYCGAKCRNRGKTRGKSKPVLVKCERCGKEFTTRNRGGAVPGVRGGTARFCSKSCSVKKPVSALQVDLLRDMTRRIRVCRTCGGVYVSGGTGAFCSEECRGEFYRDAARQAGGWNVTRACLTCGTVFDAPSTGGRRSYYCSDECRLVKIREIRSTAKARRRARLRGTTHESINPFDVFARDHWTCQICGDKTPRKLRGTYDDKAPELDHIISLAAGGTHTWNNVQCACRACNQTKGAGAAVDQLRLELTA